MMIDAVRFGLPRQMEKKIAVQCARCLEPVVEEVQRTLTFYSPMPEMSKPERRTAEGLRDIGFIRKMECLWRTCCEQVCWRVPMKAICRSACRRVVAQRERT